MAQTKNRAESAQTESTKTEQSGRTAEKEQTMNKEQKNNKAPKAEQTQAEQTQAEQKKARKSAPKAETENKKLAKVADVDTESNKALIAYVKAVTDAQTINGALTLIHGAELKTKEVIFPKTVKAEELQNVTRLVVGKMLYFQNCKSLAETAKLDKAEENEPLTESQQNKRASLADQRALIKATKTKAKATHAELIADSLADLLAVKWSGETLPINLQPLALALTENYKALHRGALALAKDGKAELTEEERASVKAVQNALVSTMGIYCKGSQWFNEFKLSASATDAVMFYELSVLRYTDGEPTFIFTADKSGKYTRELSNALIDWLLTKLKASTN